MNTKLEHVPQDILKHMLSFMDDKGYLNARSVCTLWYSLSGYSWFNTVLFPQRFAPQRLHRYLNDYQKNLAATNPALDTASTWSEAQQNHAFHYYMQGIYQHSTTSTPLDFLINVKNQLLERHPIREIEDNSYAKNNLLTRAQLLDNWQHYPLHISHIFNPGTLNHLNSIADIENNIWDAKTSGDIECIQNIYDAARALESLISAGIILMHANVNDDEWNFFKNDRTTLWTGMLTGRDVLILDMRLGRLAKIVEQAIESQLPAASISRSHYGITLDTGLVLLKKLTPHNLVQFIWNYLLHHQIILKAVQQRQPEICALLLQMSPQQLHQVCLRGSKLAIGLINHPDLLLKISDKTLITVFKECSSLNLVYLMMTPELIARLSSANFLAAFNDVVLWKESNHVTREDTQHLQSVFVKYLLTTVDIVKCLPVNTIETLLRLSYLNVNEAMVSTLIASDQLLRLSPSALIALFNTSHLLNIAHVFTHPVIVECVTRADFLAAVDTVTLWNKSYNYRSEFIKLLLTTQPIVEKLPMAVLEKFFLLNYVAFDAAIVSTLFMSQKLHLFSANILILLFTTCPPKNWASFLSHERMAQRLTSDDFLSTLDELELWHHDAQKRATFLHVFLTTDALVKWLSVATLEKFFLLGYVKPNQAILSTLLQHEKLHTLSPQTLITLLSLCPAQDVTPLLDHDIMVNHVTSEEFLNVFDDEELWAQHPQQRAEFLHRLLTTPKLVQALPSAFIETCFINAYIVPDAALLATLATCKVVHQLTPQCFIFMVNHCPLEEGVAWLSSAPMIDYVTSTTFLTAMKDSTLWHKAGESHDLDALHRQRFIDSVLTTPAILQQLSPHVMQHYLHAYDGALDERLIKPLLRYKKLPWDVFLNRYHRDKDLFESLPEVKDYAFELLNQDKLLYEAMQNLAQYIRPLLDLLSLALVSSQVQTRICYLLQQPWFMAEVSKATLQSWRRITFSFNAQLISAELTRRDNDITDQRAQLRAWHATQNSQQFPPWSLAIMIGVSMTAMACIMLASLSLGQVDAATQAIDYLHHQLHLTFPTVYTEVGLLISGIAFYLIIIAASILRKNTYTPYPYPPSLSIYDPFMQKSTLEEKTQNNPYCYGPNADVEESTELSLTSPGALSLLFQPKKELCLYPRGAIESLMDEVAETKTKVKETKTEVNEIKIKIKELKKRTAAVKKNSNTMNEKMASLEVKLTDSTNSTKKPEASTLASDSDEEKAEMKQETTAPSVHLEENDRAEEIDPAKVEPQVGLIL